MIMSHFETVEGLEALSDPRHEVNLFWLGSIPRIAFAVFPRVVGLRLVAEMAKIPPIPLRALPSAMLGAS